MFRSFNETQDNWNKIKTVQDFKDWQSDPMHNIQEFLDKSSDPREAGFWQAAEINLPSELELYLDEPDIKHHELSSINRPPSEIKLSEKHNFTTGYNRHKADGFYKEIAKALGFGDDATIYINNQEPGNLVFRHMDYLGCYTDEQDGFLHLEYDKKNKQPKGMKDVWRCFVALDDWHPGQIFSFEPHFWTHWKKGDVVFFDWRNTPHSTSNCGIKDRPILKITGVIDNDDYVLIAKDDGLVKTIDL